MQVYQNKVREYEKAALKLVKVLNRLSTIRLLAFIISLVLIVFLANERFIYLLLAAVPLCVLGFGLLINRYNSLFFTRRHTAFLKEINEDEILKLENKLSGFPAGESYLDRAHPYVSDLDIFGSHSLFQLLNRTATESGQILLAEWLNAPASKDIILARQQAIQELTPKLDWRQQFQASGKHYKYKKSDYNQLLAWIDKPEKLLPRQSRYIVASILLSVLSTTAAVYYGVHAFSGEYVIYLIPLTIILGVNFLILRKIKPIFKDILDNVHNKEILGSYQLLIKSIESNEFQATRLKKLQKAFSENNYSAGKEIGKLQKILEIVDNTGNKFYPVFNIFWLLDIYWIIMTEKWKVKNKSYLSVWASAVSEFEVLSSLAGFHYSNPSFAFPDILDKPYNIHFEEIGHPLIGPEKRVSNNFNLHSRGEIAMITGSNMAGKSTFLRTVGVNLTLAFMGAPCCAKAAQVSNLQIFTSMRTRDNLEEGISSFYAELKRIEQLLKLVESNQPVFFLLDEMFKGTNSKDRHKGGFSLIRQLAELNAFGIISTHDLELAGLAGQQKIVSNYSFNSKIQEGEIIFNYKLTQGLCNDFNASELMKKSGIHIISNGD